MFISRGSSGNSDVENQIKSRFYHRVAGCLNSGAI